MSHSGSGNVQLRQFDYREAKGEVLVDEHPHLPHIDPEESLPEDLETQAVRPQHQRVVRISAIRLSAFRISATNDLKCRKEQRNKEIKLIYLHL